MSNPMKTMKAFPILLIFILPTLMLGQGTHDPEKYDDITPAGPYSIYVTGHWSFLMGHKDFRNWTGTKKQPRGIGFALGHKVGKTTFLEGGYERYSARLTDGQDTVMTLHTFSTRLGFRYTLFYPIGFHFQGGLFLRNARFRIGDNGANEQWMVTAQTYNVGVEGRVKLVFLDPVGTGGGPGFYLEYRYRNLLDDEQFNINGVIFERDNTNHAFSVGVIVPLALKKI